MGMKLLFTETKSFYLDFCIITHLLIWKVFLTSWLRNFLFFVYLIKLKRTILIQIIGINPICTQFEVIKIGFWAKKGCGIFFRDLFSPWYAFWCISTRTSVTIFSIMNIVFKFIFWKAPSVISFWPIFFIMFS